MLHAIESILRRWPLCQSKKFLASYGAWSYIILLQESATGPDPEADESELHPPTQSPKNPFKDLPLT
jgi:hypothetical protein